MQRVLSTSPPVPQLWCVLAGVELPTVMCLVLAHLFGVGLPIPVLQK